MSTEEPPARTTARVLDGFFRRHPDQLYLWRREGDSFVLEDYNDEALRMSGGRVSKILGQDIRVLGANAPEALAAVERAWRENRVVPAQFRYRYRATGEVRELHVVYVPIPPDHVVSHASDFTDILQDARSLRERGEALEAHRERLRALAAYQDRVREEERLRLSRELHDELGQRLTVLHLELRRALREAPETLRADMESVADGLSDALEVTRELSRRLRPSVLDELGLPAALQWQLRHLRERTRVETELCVPEEEPELAPSVAAALFRIAQESLTNATRHARAGRVRVRLAMVGGEVRLLVEDDGAGFDPAALERGGLGLLTMEERAASLGGTFRVHSRPGEGCTVEVRVPLREGSDPAPPLSTPAPVPPAADR